MKLFWVSFANTGGPLGLVITEARDERGALRRINKLGINPGGEAMVFDMSKPERRQEVEQLPKDYLMSPVELKRRAIIRFSDVSEEAFEYISRLPGVKVICEDCNKP